MIELNKKYSAHSMVKNLEDFGYDTFIRNKEECERHLERFWFYKKEPKGRITYYTFTE